jgi:hypothetical protein
MKYYSAICFAKNNEILKYRNIKDLKSFEIFISKKNINYVNYYFKNNKLFSHRIYLNKNPYFLHRD